MNRIRSFRQSKSKDAEEQVAKDDDDKSTVSGRTTLDERRITIKNSSSTHSHREDSRDDDSWSCFSPCADSTNVVDDEYEEVHDGDTSSRSGKSPADIGQKKVVYEAFGDIPNEVMFLEACNRIPKPSSTDVVIKVEASSVSLNDCLIRRGLLESVSLPVTPGYDVVGRVISCGDGVASKFNIHVDDRVAALIRTGGNARYVVAPAQSLVEVPKQVKSTAAACLVSVYMTAYQSLNMVMPKSSKSKSSDTKSKKKPPLDGRKVLITGGAGPIGQALIQLCNNAGALVFATAPADHQKYVRTSLKAKPLPIDPKLWLASTKGMMDIVFDSQCQDGYKSSHEALSKDGTLVCIGMSSMLYSQQHQGMFGAQLSSYWTSAQANYFMNNTKSYNVWESFQNDPKQFKQDLTELMRMLRKNEISPNIVKKVALSQVGNAQSYIEHGKAKGTIVCEPWKKAPKQKKIYG